MGDVFVDARERFVEPGTGDLIDLLDRLHGVVDGLDQVSALHFEEAMPLGGFLVLVERHHVDGADLFEAIAEGPAGFFFQGQSFVKEPFNGFVGAQDSSFNIDFGEAASFQVFKVGQQLGGSAGAGGAIFAELVERDASCLEFDFECGQLLAQSLGLGRNRLGLGQSSAPCLCQILLSLCQTGVLGQPLLALGLSPCTRLFELEDAAFEIVVEPVDSLEACLRATAALLKASQFRSHACGFLLQLFAGAAQHLLLRL